MLSEPTAWEKRLEWCKRKLGRWQWIAGPAALLWLVDYSAEYFVDTGESPSKRVLLLLRYAAIVLLVLAVVQHLLTYAALILAKKRLSRCIEITPSEALSLRIGNLEDTQNAVIRHYGVDWHPWEAALCPECLKKNKKVPMVQASRDDYIECPFHKVEFRLDHEGRIDNLAEAVRHVREERKTLGS